MKYSKGVKRLIWSPDKANATSVIYRPSPPPQMEQNLTHCGPSGLEMGLRRDDILAPELRSSSVGFWGDGLIKYTTMTTIRFKLFYIHIE